jgi:hypothetical protein
MKTLLQKIIICWFIMRTGTICFSQDCNDPNAILTIKKNRIGSYEYVIFNIRNPFSGNYTIRSATPANFDFDEGASAGTTVVGCRYQRIQFTQMNWFCTPIRLQSGGITTIKEIKNAGQFEGYMTFIIGYRCPASRYLGIYQYPGTIVMGGTTIPVTKVVLRFQH